MENLFDSKGDSRYSLLICCICECLKRGENVRIGSCLDVGF